MKRIAALLILSACFISVSVGQTACPIQEIDLEKPGTKLTFEIPSRGRANFGNVSTHCRTGAVGFSIGKIGYVGTGNYKGDKNDFWEFDPTAILTKRYWTKKTDFPGSARYAAVGFSIGEKGYIGTGRASSGTNSAMSDFYEYDPGKNIWTRIADFPGKPRSYAYGFALNGKGYVGGGYDNTGTPLSDFYEYDPASTPKWSRKADFSGGPRAAAFSFSIYDKAYVGTGSGPNGQTLNDFWEYDNNVWSQKASLPSGQMEGGTGIGYGGKGYVWHTKGSIYEYNPALNRWDERPRAGGASPRSSAVCFNIVDSVYFGTGFENAELADFWEYTPQKSSYFFYNGSSKYGSALKGPDPTVMQRIWMCSDEDSFGPDGKPTLSFETKSSNSTVENEMQKINFHFLYKQNGNGVIFGTRRFIGFNMLVSGEVPSPGVGGKNKDILVFQMWQGAPHSPPFCAQVINQNGKAVLKFRARNNAIGSNPGKDPEPLGEIADFQYNQWYQFVLELAPNTDIQSPAPGNSTLRISYKLASDPAYTVVTYNGKWGYYQNPQNCPYARKCNVTAPNPTIDFGFGPYRPVDSTYFHARFNALKMGETFECVDPTPYNNPLTSPNAVAFDGVNDTVKFPWDLNQHLENFTLEATVYWTGGEFTLAGKRNLFWFGIEPDGTLAYYNGNNVTCLWQGGAARSKKGAVKPNQFTHIAIRNDGWNGISFFVNGTKINTDPLYRAIPRRATDCGGGLEVCAKGPAGNKISELRFWLNSRTNVEIQDNMHCLSTPPTQSQPYFYCRFDGIKGNTNVPVLSAKPVSGGTMVNMDANAAWIRL